MSASRDTFTKIPDGRLYFESVCLVRVGWQEEYIGGVARKLQCGRLKRATIFN